MIREQEIDGDLADDLDEEMVAELWPAKRVQQMKFNKALAQLKRFFAEREAEQKQAEAQEAAAQEAEEAEAAESTTGVLFVSGTWKFLSCAYLKGLSPDQPLPECRKLLDAGVLITMLATEEDMLLGDVFDKVLIISHRWESKTHPDPKCTKLRKLQDYLTSERPDIEYIWLDYCCLPQGKKTEQEKEFFNYCLYSVNLLYLQGRVLVFVDKECTCRV